MYHPSVGDEIPEILEKNRLRAGLGKVFASYAKEKADSKFEGEAHKALRQAVIQKDNRINFKKGDSDKEIEKNLEALTKCFPPEMQKEINAAFDIEDRDEKIRVAKAFHDNFQAAASAHASQLEEFNVTELARLSTSQPPVPAPSVVSPTAIKDPDLTLPATTTTVSTMLLAAAHDVTSSSTALHASGDLVSPSEGTTSLSSSNTFLPQHTASKTPATGNMSGVGAISAAEWLVIKTEIEKIYTAAKVNHSPDGNTIRVTEPEHSISRDANGVSVSSTATPPDIGAMVKSFKATGKTECDIGASAGPDTTAKLIIELQSSPNPVKPNITNKKILDDLEKKAATDSTCKQAFELYKSVNSKDDLDSSRRLTV